MSRCKDLNEQFSKLVEAKSFIAQFKSEMGKVDKASKKFWKDLGKKYPETKDAYDDPKKGDAAYPEFEKYLKADKDAQKKAYSLAVKMIPEMEKAIEDKDEKALLQIMSMDKAGRFDKSPLDYAVEGGFISKSDAKTLGKLSIAVSQALR